MHDYVSVNFEALATAAASLSQRAKMFRNQMDLADTQAKPLEEVWVKSGSSAGQGYLENKSGLQLELSVLTGKIVQLSKAIENARLAQLANETKFRNQFEHHRTTTA